MRKGGFAEENIDVDESDPSGLKAGEWVEVWPTDSGIRHRDQGSLVGLSGPCSAGRSGVVMPDGGCLW